MQTADVQRYCDQMAATGECQNNPSLMAEKCAKSCVTCGDVQLPEPLAQVRVIANCQIDLHVPVHEFVWLHSRILVEC